MKKVDLWPPPDWTEVVVLWDDILGGPQLPINEILVWVEHEPGDEYHLHGYRSTEGFAFRFKNPQDAVHFKLKWS